ncbi:MAG: phosphodiesterase [Chloroflexi bacterium]|nr:phosphodiesterase [Chloroflexota bacterium]
MFRKRSQPKVLVIGLDCAGPQLVFDQWRDQLPNMHHLMERGIYGDLVSSTPAITVPAWSSMLTSRDPGSLGIYGFRNRADYSYSKLSIATGSAVKEKRVWDLLGEAGKQVIVQGVPQTYPVSPVNGCLVSCFLTPSVQNQFTYPAELRQEIDRALDGRPYEFDVKDFRTENKDWLLQQIYAMNDIQFTVSRYLLDNKPWDFAMFVDMGVDRIHHGMWKYHDTTHPKHEPGNRYQFAIRDYYQHIDRQIGSLLQRIPDDTLVLTVSDHGVKGMMGGLCVNEWLRREGLLVLSEEPSGNGLLPFSSAKVDWSRTRVWGEGGYYARIFMNVRDREPQGVIDPEQYEGERDALAARIEALPGPDGSPLGTRVFKPQSIYQTVNGIAPDLIVYWGNLAWRSVGSLGHPDIYTFENDTGPDDANHAENGMFIVSGAQVRSKGQRVAARQLMDIAPTILRAYGLETPAAMQGHAIDY